MDIAVIAETFSSSTWTVWTRGGIHKEVSNLRPKPVSKLSICLSWDFFSNCYLQNKSQTRQLWLVSAYLLFTLTNVAEFLFTMSLTSCQKRFINCFLHHSPPNLTMLVKLSFLISKRVFHSIVSLFRNRFTQLIFIAFSV